VGVARPEDQHALQEALMGHGAPPERNSS